MQIRLYCFYKENNLIEIDYAEKTQVTLEDVLRSLGEMFGEEFWKWFWGEKAGSPAMLETGSPLPRMVFVNGMPVNQKEQLSVKVNCDDYIEIFPLLTGG